MAHGDKKWIVAYDGKIKRSRHRTKEDYYRNLKWWEADEGNKWSWKEKKAQHCPQCAHVRKHIEAEKAEIKKVQDILQVKYDAKYGEAVKAWQNYHRNWWRYSYDYDLPDGTRIYGDLRLPKMPEPPTFWVWVRKQPEYIRPWDYNWRSYLCWKCERKQDEKDKIWWRSGEYPGRNAHYQWVRKQEYRNYRNEVKNMMQRAKYDDEYYEDIPAYKHGWLD